MSQMPAAFVFDMDGVLIDSHPAHLAAWQEFLSSVGAGAAEHELAYILEGRTRAEILRKLLGDLSEQELQIFGRRKDEIFRRLESRIPPIAGALPLLKRLSTQGAKLAVATSASEIRTFATIERLGLGGSFDAVVTASDVAAGKPNPEVYELACMRLGVSAPQALAFDDALAGVQAARSAGMRCVGVASNGIGQQLLAAGAEAVIPDFASWEFRAIATHLLGGPNPG